MENRAEFPTYKERDLSGFVTRLSACCFRTQREAGKHFGIDRSRISRFDSAKARPPLGYIAELARQIAIRAEDQNGAEQILLAEVNKAIHHHYNGMRLADWSALSQLAEEYLARHPRSAKNQAKARRLLLHGRISVPSHSQLIGVESHIKALVHQLTKPGPPWIIAIEGLGGIGKTSLAARVSQELIDTERFADFGWVSARTENLNFGGAISPIAEPLIHVGELFDQLATQLATDANGVITRSPNFDAYETLKVRLRQRPHLVVIDNLETVADIETLVPQLQQLSNPSKFLLTTRKSLYTEDLLHHFQLRELSKDDALLLMRQEGTMRNFQRIVEASDSQLAQAYEVVGGNPLALRLVVGQAHSYALDRVIANLHEARGQQSDTLYTYIYFEAWKRLNEDERTILLSMPLLAPTRGDMKQLSMLTELPLERLEIGLTHLVALNLIDSNQALLEQDLLFSIHSLTRSFLHKQIAKWH